MLDFLYSESAFIAVLIIVLWIFILCVLALIPASMAEHRGRSYWGWFFFSVLFSCFLGILFVAALGETDEHRKKRIIEEEMWRRGIGVNKEASSASSRFASRASNGY